MEPKAAFSAQQSSVAAAAAVRADLQAIMDDDEEEDNGGDLSLAESSHPSDTGSPESGSADFLLTEKQPSMSQAIMEEKDVSISDSVGALDSSSTHGPPPDMEANRQLVPEQSSTSVKESGTD